MKRTALSEVSAAAKTPARWPSANLRAPRAGGKRVLVLGCSPLPFENERMNYAPGTRTWQFARPLADAGHAVCVAAMRIPGAYAADRADVRQLRRDGVVIYTLPQELFDSAEALSQLVARLEPEVLVGASALPSRKAVLLAESRPVWVDFFGDPMAEAQVRSAVTGEDDMTAYADLMVALLERGDAFSAVSEYQRNAVIGQLGLYGRLNRATYGRELVHVVPCSAEGVERPADGAATELADDAFIVLWSGGYNTWCDVETLFQALETAMARNPAIHFVSTGEQIEGHDEQTYPHLVRLVEASARRDRFHLKGRLPADRADRYLARADLGVVTEKRIYERHLGSSGRVVRWLAQGVPLICAEISELSHVVAEAELGMTYPPGDSATLGRLIAEAAADRDRLRRYGERARRFAAREWTYERTTRALVEWAGKAERLPDQDRAAMRLRWITPTQAAEQTRRKTAELEELVAEKQRVLDDIHRSKAWRWWMRYLAARRWLTAPLAWLRGRRGRQGQ